MRLIARLLIAHLATRVSRPPSTVSIGETWREPRGASEARAGCLLERTGAWDDDKGRANDQDRETREEGSELMKTMTCKQLGGPCDHQHQGQAADEVIKAQDRHLKEMVAGGDTAHAPALKEMKGRWKHPISGMGWYRAAKRNFAALPED
jgi:hypothetical protein